MTNQDRINKAKEELTEWVEMHSGMVPSEDLNAFEEEVKDRQWFIEQAEKVERYEKAVQLALMTLENNNLMNDDYRKIHSILDGDITAI